MTLPVNSGTEPSSPVPPFPHLIEPERHHPTDPWPNHKDETDTVDPVNNRSGWLGFGAWI